MVRRQKKRVLKSKARKEKVIRVESEQTQDFVQETLAISQEEAEEMGSVPSALGEPRGAIYWCDNRRSEKAIRYWHIASLVIEEGDSICVSSATMKSCCSRANSL